MLEPIEKRRCCISSVSFMLKIFAGEFSEEAEADTQKIAKSSELFTTQSPSKDGNMPHDTSSHTHQALIAAFVEGFASAVSPYTKIMREDSPCTATADSQRRVGSNASILNGLPLSQASSLIGTQVFSVSGARELFVSQCTSLLQRRHVPKITGGRCTPLTNAPRNGPCVTGNLQLANDDVATNDRVSHIETDI